MPHRHFCPPFARWGIFIAKYLSSSSLELGSFGCTFLPAPRVGICLVLSKEEEEGAFGTCRQLRSWAVGTQLHFPFSDRWRLALDILLSAHLASSACLPSMSRSGFRYSQINITAFETGSTLQREGFGLSNSGTYSRLSSTKYHLFGTFCLTLKQISSSVSLPPLASYLTALCCWSTLGGAQPALHAALGSPLLPPTAGADQTFPG